MKKTLICCLFTLVCSPSFAGQKVLSWSDCVELAIHHNSDLQANFQKLASARDLEGVARSAFFPTVNGVVSYDRGNTVINNATTPGGTPVGASTSSISRYTTSLTASDNLFNGMQDLASIRQAEANSASTAAVVDTHKAQVSYDLKSAYQGLLYAKEYEQFTTEIIRRREADLSLVQLLFESGHENKGSLLLSKAYLEQARYEDLQSHDAHFVAATQLARALGLDQDLSFDIKDPIPQHEPAPQRPDLTQLAQLTPDVRKASADEQAANQGITIARSNFFPTLNLKGSVGKQGSEFLPRDTDQWSVDASLVFPLFAGGHDYYNTRSAGELWRSAESARQHVNRDLLAKLAAAYTGYLEAVGKLKVDQSFRQAAILRAEIARKRYNNGLMTFEDWDLIETDLINRERAFLQSKRDRVIAEAAWEQAQGKGAIP